MVSSQCCQVESPSPFRFFAALIPPCAQTECERFTGTMENRSTLPPISAILMTAARPASPPPTTMIFGAAAISIHRPFGKGSRAVIGIHDIALRRRLLEAHAERIEADQSDNAQKKEKCEAQAKESLLRMLAGNDAPLRREEPNTVGEVPRCGDQSDDVEREQRGVNDFVMHFSKRLRGHL